MNNACLIFKRHKTLSTLVASRYCSFYMNVDFLLSFQRDISFWFIDGQIWFYFSKAVTLFEISGALHIKEDKQFLQER